MNRSAVGLGVADHLGWAVVVAVSTDLAVVDRRRIELVGAGLPAAPVHHEGGAHDLHRTGDPLTDEELAALVARVRASAAVTIASEFDRLAAELAGEVTTVSLRAWPADFPTDIARVRRAPFESRADPIMYRRLLAEAASARGWSVVPYDPASIEAEAIGLVGADPELLRRPRAELGPPWTKDHRTAYASAIVAALARR